VVGGLGFVLVYQKVPLDPAMKSHPMVVDGIHNLGDTSVVEVDEKKLEHEVLIAMLQDVSKVFETHDIVEEDITC
jgi:hypothetical protein